jgi:hypothetical protein
MPKRLAKNKPAALLDREQLRKSFEEGRNSSLFFVCPERELNHFDRREDPFRQPLLREMIRLIF